MRRVHTVRSKASRVRDECIAHRDLGEQRFALTPEIACGVRLVLVDVGGHTVTFSLWTLADDVAFLAADPMLPTLTAALAIDESEMGALMACGYGFDSAWLTRSLQAPNLYYSLLHYASRRQIERRLRRVLTEQPSATAA